MYSEEWWWDDGSEAHSPLEDLCDGSLTLPFDPSAHSGDHPSSRATCHGYGWHF